MSYYSDYQERLLSKGTSNSDVLIRNSKNMINKNFLSSPSFKVIQLNNADTDSIINLGNTSSEKDVIFRPDTVVNTGDVVGVDSKNYLVMDVVFNNVYPKANVKLCNSVYTITTQPNVIGYDELDNPIYDSTSPSTLDIPCIVESTISMVYDNQAINLPENKLKVTIPYTIHSEIAIDKEFNMYGNKYKIKGIDYTKSINQVGLMILTGERV